MTVGDPDPAIASPAREQGVDRPRYATGQLAHLPGEDGVGFARNHRATSAVTSSGPSGDSSTVRTPSTPASRSRSPAGPSRRGLLVHEEYLHGYEPHVPHFNASAAKSYLGLVAAVLAHEGQLDRGMQVARIVPSSPAPPSETPRSTICSTWARS
ncbi:amide hydrolase [Streptomyces alboflavus]|uniref:Amide hydrolase n=1 Tax=Streptomyces alboflavus TaxID=67267 RepID=A0A1Z1WPE3_9ACTN|nr:hypothetical protein [Streptomyces alboflavus]ARX88295.1 amide hydrolase [Streptomyces alboflavus]